MQDLKFDQQNEVMADREEFLTTLSEETAFNFQRVMQRHVRYNDLVTKKGKGLENNKTTQLEKLFLVYNSVNFVKQ